MPKPFRWRFKPFSGGQNTHVPPFMLDGGDQQPEGVGVRALGCDIRSGTLKGMYGPGTEVATVTAGSTFLFLHNDAWLAGTGGGSVGDPPDEDWACADYPKGGNQVTYRTRYVAGVVAAPQVLEGANTYQLGVTAPTAAPTDNGAGAGGNVQYAYCYVDEDSGTAILVSNPSPDSATVLAGGTVTITASGDARISHIYVYRTQEADPDGIKYYLGKIVAPATTLNTAPLSVDIDQPLDWGPGGNYGDDLAVEDHAPAPNITVLPNALHGGANILDGNQGGTLFYADGAILGWTHTGRPQYFPAVNKFRLPATILALVTDGTTTYAFTEVGIWAATGATDEAIVVVKTPAIHNIQRYSGKTAVLTPHGILYYTDGGHVALFDGRQSVLITDGRWRPYNTFSATSTSFNCAFYYDDYYFLSNASLGQTFTLDMRRFPQALAISYHAIGISAAHVIPSGVTSTTAANGGKGLHVVIYSDGKVKPWQPERGAGVFGAARQASQWKTGVLTFGDQSRPKRWDRIRLNGRGGNATVKFFTDIDVGFISSDVLDLAFTFTVALPMPAPRFLPRNLRGKTLTMLVDLPAGVELYPGSEIEGVFYDG